MTGTRSDRAVMDALVSSSHTDGGKLTAGLEPFPPNISP